MATRHSFGWTSTSEMPPGKDEAIRRTAIRRTAVKILIVLGLLWSSPATASISEPRLEGCMDGRREIRVEERADLEQIIRAARQPGTDEPVLLVNPARVARSSLSSETLEWLFHRQCAHILRGHLDLPEPSRAMEEEADCAALEALLERDYAARDLRTIERDLDRLEARDWNDLALGSKRKIDLFSCREARPLRRSRR